MRENGRKREITNMFYSEPSHNEAKSWQHVDGDGKLKHAAEGGTEPSSDPAEWVEIWYNQQQEDHWSKAILSSNWKNVEWFILLNSFSFKMKIIHEVYVRQAFIVVFQFLNSFVIMMVKS